MALADNRIDGPSNNPGLREAFSILRHHWVLISAITVLVAGGAVVTTQFLPRIYTATGVVAVRSSSPDPFHSMLADTSNKLDNSAVATEIVALKSRDLGRQVVSALGLGATRSPSLVDLVCDFLHRWGLCSASHDPPTMGARLDSFVEHLDIVPAEQTGDRSLAISISFRAKDPSIAAQVVNKLIDLREEEEIARQSDGLERTAAWLDQRTDELRKRWFAAEQAVAQFRDANGLTQTLAGDRMAPLVGQQVASAATEFAKSQAELAGAKARQNALRQALEAGDKRALIRLADQPILVSLAKTLDELNIQRSMLGESYRPNLLGALNATIAATERKLNQESRNALAEINTGVAIKQAEARQIEQNLIDLKAQSAALSGPLARLQTLEHEAADANSVYVSFLARANEMSNRRPSVMPTTEIIARADVPEKPSFPRLGQFLAAGVLFGFVGGAGAGWAREKSSGYKDLGRVAEQLSLQLISTVPLVSDGLQARVPLHRYMKERPFSAAAEAVRSLAASLALANRSPEMPCAVAITSAVGQEGKSTLCCWLAEVVARDGHSVLLINGDWRKLAGTNRLGPAGLTDVLAGRASLQSVIIRGDSGTMDYLPAGQPRSSAFIGAELDRLRALVEEAKRHYALVVIDTPPLLGMAEALMFANVADQSVFVCRWPQTNAAAAASCLRRLRDIGANVTGVVLSMVDMERLPLYSGEYDRRSMRMLKQYYQD